MARRRSLLRLAAPAALLLVWQLAAMGLGEALLLPSPLRTLERLGQLLRQDSFWRALPDSLGRTAAGFLLGVAAGGALAALAGRFPALEALLRPWVAAAKSVPPASIILLCLVWLSARQLPVFISFLVVFPVIYIQLLQGIRSADAELLEMARVFRVPLSRRLLRIWPEQLRPYLRSACSAALGLGWKAGITAEIIGIPAGSVGERLYEAKLYLDTPSLFAWTAVIVLLGAGFERLLLIPLAADRDA